MNFFIAAMNSKMEGSVLIKYKLRMGTPQGLLTI
jgi:hypothetical protein